MLTSPPPVAIAATKCQKALPIFKLRAADVLEKSRKLSTNFETFRISGKGPECKATDYLDDGGHHCSFKCVYSNGESATVKIILFQRKNETEKGKNAALENIELVELAYESGA